MLGALYYLRPVPELLAAEPKAGGRAPLGIRVSLLGAAPALVALSALPYFVYVQVS